MTHLDLLRASFDSTGSDSSEVFVQRYLDTHPGGCAFHSFWYGEEVQEFDGLMFYHHTEMEAEDSLFAVLRRP